MLLKIEPISITNNQGCGNIEPTIGHFDLFSPLFLLPIYFVHKLVEIIITQISTFVYAIT